MAGAAQLATSALNTLQSLQTQQHYLLIDSYANGDDLYRRPSSLEVQTDKTNANV